MRKRSNPCTTTCMVPSCPRTTRRIRAMVPVSCICPGSGSSTLLSFEEQADQAVSLHRLFDELHRPGDAHGQGNDGEGEGDRIAKREDR